MRSLSCLCLMLAACAAAPRLQAQTTDGFSALQVVPVVVDSTSFKQRFSFHNPNDSQLDIVPEYYPGAGTTGVHITCPTISIPAYGSPSFASLRALCPALAAGSQFGFLYLRHQGFRNWTVFSRVSNPQGAGFAVEGFPASTFSSAISMVGGVRRLAATANSPAYQTNCFVANLPTFSPAVTPQTTKVMVSLHEASDPLNAIGYHEVDVPPGSMVRILDVFSTSIPGDFDDVNVTFFQSTGVETAIAGFCTVQDNTSFGADFRIAKPVAARDADLGLHLGWGTQDQHSRRDVAMNKDDLGRSFTIPAGAFNNVHVLSVRLPDYGRCELLDASFQPVTPAYGLEMRIMDGAGQTLFGGNNSVFAPDFSKQPPEDAYFGDKNQAITNATWFIQVESNGQNTGVDRPYALRCRTGSGAGRLHLVRYQAAGTEF